MGLLTDTAASRRSRLAPVALAAGVALVVAAWAGLVRLGFGFGRPPVALHGPLMVLGFLGSVIAAERAVGLGRGWAWFPAWLAALGTGVVLGGWTIEGLYSQLLAGLGLAAVYLAALRLTNFAWYMIVESLGVVAWVAATAALVAGVPVRRTVPALAAFLVVTILGERLELSRMSPGQTAGRGRLVLILAIGMVAASVAALWTVEVGPRMAGAFGVGLAVVSARGDIARRTVKAGGVAGYMAAAVLAGYVWLSLGGILWVAGLLVKVGGYDPALHAIFVGFVLSMIFAHAPVIVPAVAGVRLPFRASWWVALVLLHLTLAVRIYGGLVTVEELRRWGGIGNVVALVAFVGLAVWSGISARE